MKAGTVMFRVAVSIWVIALSSVVFELYWMQRRIKKLQLASYKMTMQLTSIMMTRLEVEGGPYDKEIFQTVQKIQNCDTWNELHNLK